MSLAVAVFLLTYLGMALGRVPGFSVERTGIALIAVVLLGAFGDDGPEALGRHVDWPTLLLLFGLMIVSAQFAFAGFYAGCAAWLTRAELSPPAGPGTATCSQNSRVSASSGDPPRVARSAGTISSRASAPPATGPSSARTPATVYPARSNAAPIRRRCSDTRPILPFPPARVRQGRHSPGKAPAHFPK